MMALLILTGTAMTALAEDRTPVSRTVIGGHRDIQQCATAAAEANLSQLAIDACDAALERRLSDNDRVLMLVNRGVLRLGRRESTLALTDFDAALAVDPRHAEAHMNRGAALVQMARPGPAVAALTEALSLGVREPYKAYYNRAAAREALGDVRGAYEDYTTALEIRPEWAPAEAEIARFVRARQERLAGMLTEAAAEAPQ